MAISCFLRDKLQNYWLWEHWRLHFKGVPRSLGSPWRASRMLIFFMGLVNGEFPKKTGMSQHWFPEMACFEAFLLVGTKTQNCHIIPEGLSTYTYIYMCVYMFFSSLKCLHQIRLRLTGYQWGASHFQLWSDDANMTNGFLRLRGLERESIYIIYIADKTTQNFLDNIDRDHKCIYRFRPKRAL